MTLHDGLALLNSGLLIAILGGLVRFHRDWTEMRLMVRVLWKEHETRDEARITIGERERAKAMAATAGK